MTNVAPELQRNAEATQRLRDLVARLNRDDLRRSLGGGWTIGVALAHLAFWDARQRAALSAYLASGSLPDEDDSTNPALDALAPLLDVDAAGALAVRIAEQVDSFVAALPPDVLAAPDRFPVLRWRHREEHIDQIEAALG